jgi:hypothetical protein
MAMSEKPNHRKTRIISVVAATAISLACGTNVWRNAIGAEQSLTRCSMPTLRGHRNSPRRCSYLRRRVMSLYESFIASIRTNRT